MTDSEPLFVQTPFSAAARAATNTGAWSAWGPYALPEAFTGARKEAAAVRRTAMIEDKSPLTKYRISGTDAEEFIDRLIPRDASKIETDHAVYTPWCDHDGKVIVEGLLFRVAPTEFWLICNEMDIWFDENRGSLDVEITEDTGAFGILAVQGPASKSILETATDDTFDELRFSRGTTTTVGSVDVRIWRTGFTGVLGYELWVPPADGNDVWDALMAVGADVGLEPCGHIAQDMVRVEAGLVLPAIDYARAGPDSAAQAHGFGITDPALMASPFELDLGRFVDFGKRDFVGRAALEAERDRPRGRRLMGIRVDWRELVEQFLVNDRLPAFPERVHRFPPLRLSGPADAYATSVTWSVALETMIGFAHIPVDHAAADVTFSLEWPDGEESLGTTARTVPLPFVQPNRK